jgi:hypothetical protein
MVKASRTRTLTYDLVLSRVGLWGTNRFLHRCRVSSFLMSRKALSLKVLRCSSNIACRLCVVVPRQSHSSSLGLLRSGQLSPSHCRHWRSTAHALATNEEERTALQQTAEVVAKDGSSVLVQVY